MSDFPTADMTLTHLLVVADLERARAWYEHVLGARPYRAYGGTSAVLQFGEAWLLLVTGGGPTPDKPAITFAAPAAGDVIDNSFTIRVADCAAAYETLLARGATFLTPPYDWGAEVRAFFRDPDGNLFEISSLGAPG